MEKQNVFTSKNSTVSYVATHKAILIEATNTYIPLEEFQETFNQVEEYVKINYKLDIKRVVFDKRSLTVFHQPSMEWYFINWKERIYNQGIRVIRKMLPDDRVFKYSVKVGREKIDQMYPNAKYHLMDIQYRDSLEEALTN